MSYHLKLVTRRSVTCDGLSSEQVNAPSGHENLMVAFRLSLGSSLGFTGF
jgi:hypothetical protein